MILSHRGMCGVVLHSGVLLYVNTLTKEVARRQGGRDFAEKYFMVGIRKKFCSLPDTNKCGTRGVAKNTNNCGTEAE